MEDSALFTHRKQKQIVLLEKVMGYIESSECFNGLYSKWNTLEEAKKELLSYIERITKNDKTVYSDLHLFFAPTGTLQEFSMDNGWGEEYLTLAKTADDIF